MTPWLSIWTAVTQSILSTVGIEWPIHYTPNTQIDISHLGNPAFTPPGSNIPGFQCDYSKYMPGWERCDTPNDKSCWLRNTNGPGQFDINTDYEDIAPIGTDRYYTLVVEDQCINADGKVFHEAKVINGTFPGTLIEACWYVVITFPIGIGNLEAYRD